MTEIAERYSKFFEKQAKEKTEEEQQITKKPEESQASTLKEYYHNGKLVKIPDDMSSFLDLLVQNNVPENEQRHILSLVANALQEEKNIKLVGFYQSGEQEIIALGNRFLDEAKNYQDFYYEIKEILSEIQALESMYIDAISLEDKNYIIEEKNNYMIRLRTLIVPEEEIEPTNIAFLSDADGETYFNKDLKDIDKGIRKRIESLIVKINNDNKRNFRKVYSGYVTDVEIYEVMNADLHVIFTEIPGNVYLVIGVATTGNGYKEITNRLANKQNRQNIAQIVEAIKHITTKKKYLLEQNSKIPSFADERIRERN